MLAIRCFFVLNNTGCGDDERGSMTVFSEEKKK
jgi:hypothetical protein